MEKPQEHRKNPIQNNQLAVGVHRPGNLVSEAEAWLIDPRPSARQVAGCRGRSSSCRGASTTVGPQRLDLSVIFSEIPFQKV